VVEKEQNLLCVSHETHFSWHLALTVLMF